jgi:hypothetical protein
MTRDDLVYRLDGILKTLKGGEQYKDPSTGEYKRAPNILCADTLIDEIERDGLQIVKSS